MSLPIEQFIPLDEQIEVQFLAHELDLELVSSIYHRHWVSTYTPRTIRSVNLIVCSHIFFVMILY